MKEPTENKNICLLLLMPLIKKYAHLIVVIVNSRQHYDTYLFI